MSGEDSPDELNLSLSIVTAPGKRRSASVVLRAVDPFDSEKIRIFLHFEGVAVNTLKSGDCQSQVAAEQTILTDSLEFSRNLERIASSPAGETHPFLVCLQVSEHAKFLPQLGFARSQIFVTQLAKLVESRVDRLGHICLVNESALAFVQYEKSVQNVMTASKDLASSIDQHVFEIDDLSFSISCTAEISLITDLAQSVDDSLMALVQPAIESTGETSDRVRFLNAGSATKIDEAIDTDVLEDIQKAIGARRIKLMAQCIVGLHCECSGMVDILTRLISRDGNILEPNVFLKTAERHRLCNRIDSIVFQAVASYVRSDSVSLAFVRLSEQSIVSPKTAVWMRRFFNDDQEKRRKIVVQVQARVLANHVIPAGKLIATLRALGCQIAISDITADPRLIAATLRFRPKFMKIDGDLVNRLPDDSDAHDSISDLVEKAKSVGAKTIAVKVERAETMTTLYRLGVDFMEGFYVQQPEVVLEKRRRSIANSPSDQTVRAQNDMKKTSAGTRCQHMLAS